MNGKVILNYTDHWLVLTALALSRSATLINFCSFNSISPALTGGTYLFFLALKMRLHFVTSQRRDRVCVRPSEPLVLSALCRRFLHVWTAPLLLFFMERARAIRGHICCFSVLRVCICIWMRGMIFIVFVWLCITVSNTCLLEIDMYSIYWCSYWQYNQNSKVTSTVSWLYAVIPPSPNVAAFALVLVTLNLQSPRSFLLIDIETLHNTEKESKRE